MPVKLVRELSYVTLPIEVGLIAFEFSQKRKRTQYCRLSSDTVLTLHLPAACSYSHRACTRNGLPVGYSKIQKRYRRVMLVAKELVGRSGSIDLLTRPLSI